MTEQELHAYIASIRPADEAAMAAARRRQAELAKPPGSLGKLEEMAVRMAGVTGQVCPEVKKCRVAVYARVSTNKESQQTSYEAQVQLRCRDRTNCSFV